MKYFETPSPPLTPLDQRKGFLQKKTKSERNCLPVLQRVGAKHLCGRLSHISYNVSVRKTVRYCCRYSHLCPRDVSSPFSFLWRCREAGLGTRPAHIREIEACTNSATITQDNMNEKLPLSSWISPSSLSTFHRQRSRLHVLEVDHMKR